MPDFSKINKRNGRFWVKELTSLEAIEIIQRKGKTRFVEALSGIHNHAKCAPALVILVLPLP
jgi:hypothetical protein